MLIKIRSHTISRVSIDNLVHFCRNQRSFVKFHDPVIVDQEVIDSSRRRTIFDVSVVEPFGENEVVATVNRVSVPDDDVLLPRYPVLSTQDDVVIGVELALHLHQLTHHQVRQLLRTCGVLLACPVGLVEIFLPVVQSDLRLEESCSVHRELRVVDERRGGQGDAQQKEPKPACFMELHSVFCSKERI
jgi:hypothetical protein